MKRWAITAVVYVEARTARAAMQYATRVADYLNEQMAAGGEEEFSVVIHSDDIPEEEES